MGMYPVCNPGALPHVCRRQHQRPDPRVVYGASAKKCGATGSVCNLFSMAFNHHPTVEMGILEEECAALLSEFFAKLRVELRSRPKWKPKENAECKMQNAK